MWFVALALLISCSTHAQTLQNPQNWMAIIGDSGVTGAVTSPNINATMENLGPRVWRAAFYELPPPTGDHLTRISYSTAESNAGRFQHWMLDFGARLSAQLDVPENSFAYQIGRQLGIAPSDIVLVGQDGVRVETLGAQFARLAEVKTDTLPPLLFISFTANDLCDIEVFDETPEARAHAFEARLDRALHEAEPFLQHAHSKGTRIYVLAPLNVVDVVTDPEVLKQPIEVEGQGQITCGQLRHGKTHLSFSSFFILRLLNLMCPSVTRTHLGDTDHLAHLRRVQELFGEVWQKKIRALNARDSKLQWFYIPEAHDLPLEAGDLAADCFHPSAHGHRKLAETVLKAISPSKSP